MTYTLRISLLDQGKIYPTTPTYSGFVWLAPLLPPFDTAVSVPPGSALAFPLVQTTPVLPTAELITHGGGGDVFRSGKRVLPPSPGDLSLVTGMGEILTAALPALLAGLAGSKINIQLPEWVRVLLGLFAFGFLPPHFITITGASVTPGAGKLDLTLTGTASYNWMFIIPLTTSFTYKVTLAVAPSADAWTPPRIVRITTSGATFNISSPWPPFVSSAVGGIVTGAVGPRIENLLNEALTGAVDSALAAAKSVRTATSVISASSIVITPNRIRFQIVIADFRFPVVPSLSLLTISISPEPAEGISVTYTIHVAARGMPVAKATVKLTNYEGPRTFTTNLPDTDENGNTTFTGTLRAFHHDATDHGGGVVDKYPYVSALAVGCYPATLELMLDSIT